MRRVLLGGAVLLGAAWLLAPAPSPPLYDGAVGPAQAYLYLAPPAGYHQTGKPSDATRDLPLTAGSSGAGFVNTAETPPQAQVLAADGTFSAPPGATRVTLSITPVPPSPIPASLGTLAGNVYQVSARADVAGAVTVSPGHPITVVLRGPAGVGNAPIARLSEGAASWERVKTVPLGSAADMVVANTDVLGDFAITATRASGGGGGSGSGGGFPLLAVVIPAVILLVALAVLLLARGGHEEPPPRRRR